jgi:hypothetical protein
MQTANLAFHWDMISRVDGIGVINRAVEDRVYLRGDETRERLEDIKNGWNLTPLRISDERFVLYSKVSSSLSNPSDEKKLDGVSSYL